MSYHSSRDHDISTLRLILQALNQLPAALCSFARLFPEAAAATDEPSEPEEEGEVTASHNDTCRYVHLLKRLLRQALRQHPTFTLSYCFGCLAAANSSHSSSGTVHPNPQVLQGVRLWLKEHLLRESTPSRESTPLGDGLAGPGAAAEGSNGNSKAAGKVSCLKHVLETSQELQAWIMQQARARATGRGQLMEDSAGLAQRVGQLVQRCRRSITTTTTTPDGALVQQEAAAVFASRCKGVATAGACSVLVSLLAPM